MRIIFSIITIDLAFFTIISSAVSHNVGGVEFPYKYMCPRIAPPPGTYPPGKSAHDFIDMYQWCRSTDGGPACACNQLSGLPECGLDGPNAGMRFDFESMTAAYPCLNCLCIDKRLHELPGHTLANSYPQELAHQMEMLTRRGSGSVTDEAIPHGQEHSDSSHGQENGLSHEAHSSGGVQIPPIHILGGTQGITITTGAKGLHMKPGLRFQTVTSGIGDMNMNSASASRAYSNPLPAKAHRLKGSLPRLNSLPSNRNGQSVMKPAMMAHSNRGFPVELGTRVHSIEPAALRPVRIIKKPDWHRAVAASPAAEPADGFPKWGLRAARNSQTRPRVASFTAQSSPSFGTLSRENPVQKISDDELGTMHRVRMSGSPNQQRMNRLRTPSSIDVDQQAESRTPSSSAGYLMDIWN